MPFEYSQSLTTAVKIVDRSVDKKDEIQAYSQARSQHVCFLVQLVAENSTAYGPSCVSYDTVRLWKKKFESGVESIKMHRNQVDQNLHLVKKSFPNKDIIEEMPDLQFVILHER